MPDRMIHATGFKQALLLAETGRMDEARALLAGLQDEFLALCEENAVLKGQLAEAAEVLDLAENMEFDGRFYWLREDGARKGPYCQVCYDRDGLLVRLQEHGKHHQCAACGGLYMKAKRGPSARAPRSKGVFRNPIPLFGE